MPKGTYVIVLPFDSDYKVLGKFFKDQEGKDFEITSNLFLRLNLDLERNDYSFLKIGDHQIFSYIYRFSGKTKIKASGLIIGLLLEENEKPEKFRPLLKDAAEELEDLDLLNMEREKFEQKLKEVYQAILEPLIDLLNPETIKQSIISRTKSLLSGSKKDRKLAQELLERVEDEDHIKISKLYKEAEKLLKENEFEKAAKNYCKAEEVSEELLGEDYEITKTLKERASFCQKIPDLSRRRDKIVQKARDALSNEDFHEAYKLYREASELSKELVQFDKEEEYRLKSKALNDFYTVDQKYKNK
ncbi:MAG: hypothetical protein BAJALOKI3v1_150059 [Promethearchaeota archaeon]|nr:MAG: hypothetical protein BAJALOKI3v1_150059 [Candidatus Lokiarchaeota archaeon]